MKNIVLALIVVCLVISCKESYTPKPRGYYRIDLPAKEYQLFDSAFPYTFEYPKYGNIESDNDINAERYWINVSFPKFKGKIHLTYKVIKNDLDTFVKDTYKFAYDHTRKADAINEIQVEDRNRKVYGIIFDIKGNAASSYQFFLTDSTRNFLRGALYFETEPNKDSLAPVIDFFMKDMDQIINTLKWK
jgi:gliding motility-associated lipoprotein GldD